MLLGKALVHKRLGDDGGVKIPAHVDGHHGAAGEVNAKVHAAAGDADDQAKDDDGDRHADGDRKILGESHQALPSFASRTP